MTGAALRVVPYRSGAAAVNDVVAGHVTFIFDQLSGGSLEMYRSGMLRPFAVTAKTRLSSAPDIPTVDEAGLPGLYVSTWYGFWAPKGTPGPSSPSSTLPLSRLWPTRLAQAAGRSGGAGSPARAADARGARAFQEPEIAKWWPIIKAANIKVE